jgi:hypothetical protein
VLSRVSRKLEVTSRARSRYRMLPTTTVQKRRADRCSRISVLRSSMFLLSQTLLKDKKKLFFAILFVKYASGAIFERQGDDSKDATAVLIMYTVATISISCLGDFSDRGRRRSDFRLRFSDVHSPTAAVPDLPDSPQARMRGETDDEAILILHSSA